MDKISSACADQNFSIAEICVLANVRVRQWYRWRAGQAIPRPSSLRRMERAIAQKAHEAKRAALYDRALSTTAYRMLLARLADVAGLNVALVLADNPQAQDKQSPARAAASRCRQRALYLIVTELNVPLVMAAGVAGISKQAVSKSLRQIEESRDDPAIDHLLDEMAGEIHGGAHG
ncbi:hypothetical protein [Cohaesibacter marisflavi]|nr:hypothetical protein [Cohaesibacter marisflavi]